MGASLFKTYQMIIHLINMKWQISQLTQLKKWPEVFLSLKFSLLLRVKYKTSEMKLFLTKYLGGGGNFQNLPNYKKFAF